MLSLAIQSMLLEHAVAKGYKNVLTEYPEVMKKALDHSPVAVALHLRTVLHLLENKPSKPDPRKDEVAVSLITSLLDLDHQVVSSSLLTKAQLSLQVVVLFHMLQKDDKNVLAKLNTYFPASGFSHPNVEEKITIKINNAQKNFRKFFIPLIGDRVKRAVYMSRDYHLEFGEGLLKKSENLLDQCCENIQKALPSTALERLMQSHKNGKFENRTKINGNILFKTLLSEIGDEKNLNEAKILDLMEKFTDRNKRRISTDDSSSDNQSFEESSTQITSSTGTSSQSQNLTQERGKDGVIEEDDNGRSRVRRTVAPKKYTENSSDDSSEEYSEEDEEQGSGKEKSEEAIILSSTEDTDASLGTKSSKNVKRLIVKQKVASRNVNSQRDMSSDLSAFQVEKKSNKGKILRRPTQVDDFESTASEAEEKKTFNKTPKKTPKKTPRSKADRAKRMATPKSIKKSAAAGAVDVTDKEGTNAALKTLENVAMNRTDKQQTPDVLSPVSGKKTKEVPKLILQRMKTPGSSSKKGVQTPKSGKKVGVTPKSGEKVAATPKSSRRRSHPFKEKEGSVEILSESDGPEEHVRPTQVAKEKDHDASKESSRISKDTPLRTSKRRSECSGSNTGTDTNTDASDSEVVALAKRAVPMKSPSPAKFARLRVASQATPSPARRASRRSSSRSSEANDGEHTMLNAQAVVDAPHPEGQLEGQTLKALPARPLPKTPISMKNRRTRSMTPKVAFSPVVVVNKCANSPLASSGKTKIARAVYTKPLEADSDAAKSLSKECEDDGASSSEESEVIPVFTPKSASSLTRVTRNSPAPVSLEVPGSSGVPGSSRVPGSSGRPTRPKRSLPSSAETSLEAKRRAASPDLMPSPKPTSLNADTEEEEEDSEVSWRTCSEPDSSSDEIENPQKSKTKDMGKTRSTQIVIEKRRSLRQSGASNQSSDGFSSDSGQTNGAELAKKNTIQRNATILPDPLENSDASHQRTTRQSLVAPPSAFSSKASLNKLIRISSRAAVSAQCFSDSDIEENQTIAFLRRSSLRKHSKGNKSPLPDLKKHLKSSLIKPCVVLLTKKMEVSTGLNKKTIIRF